MHPEDFLLDKKLVPSFVIVLLFAVFAIILSKSKKLKKEISLTPLHILMSGAFISVFFLYLPINIKKPDAVTGIVESLVESVKIFGFNTPPSALINDIWGISSLSEPNLSLGFANSVFLSFISFFPPLLTVIAALSIFKDTVAQLKYTLAFGRKAHVFSHLNSKSVCLAKDIRKNDKKAVIVFLNEKKNSSATDSQSLTADARSIKALFSRKSVFEFHCMSHKNPNIYLIDNNEADNVKNGLDFFKKNKDKSCAVYVFSSLESSETFIDALDKKGAKATVSLVNYAEIIAYDILSKYPMFRSADNCGSDTMSVLVIGTNSVGAEFAKASLWCGIMNTRKLSVRIMDSDERKRRFESNSVNIKESFKKAGIDIDYEFVGTDIADGGFSEILSGYANANYVVISADSDELTVNIALNYYKQYVRNSIKNNNYSPDRIPTVIPVISNINYYDMLLSEKDVFHPYGAFKDIYKINIINEWPIDTMSKLIHYLYSDKNPEAYNAYNSLPEKEKRSNRANAVHYIYKMKDLGIDFCLSDNNELKKKYESEGKTVLPFSDLKSYLGKPDKDNRSKSEKTVITEHNRWCAFQILNGWETWSIGDIENTMAVSDENSKIHKMPSALYHGCIAPYEELKTLGEKLYHNPEYFIEHDKKVSSLTEENIPDIMKIHPYSSEKDGNPHILMYADKEEII